MFMEVFHIDEHICLCLNLAFILRDAWNMLAEIHTYGFRFGHVHMV
jgi:hypothetical protein